MNLPPPEEIQVDIDKLRREQERCRVSRSTMARGCRSLRREQRELRRLVDNPGEYDPEALAANATRIDGQVVSIRAVMAKEDEKIAEYARIITELEKRKWQSEMTSRLTGTLPHE